MTKSLGQVARTEAERLLGRGSGIKLDIWQAAAEAVALRCDRDWAEDRELHSRERAVIEAAKALEHAYNSGPGHVVVSQTGYVRAFGDLVKAVKALQEVENG